MPSQPVRRPAVAGSWYPGTPAALGAEVDRYLGAAAPAVHGAGVRALVAPHAGLMYSGPVAAWGYKAVQGVSYEAVVMVGPSHHVGFEGVASFPRGVFDTPLGPVPIAEDLAAALEAANPVVREQPGVHLREHSLEMQLPFLRRVLPSAPIVPLLMGYQDDRTIAALADALVAVLRGRSALMIASSDLSHYLDSRSAATMDGRVVDLVRRFDIDGLSAALRAQPDHACGGGPMLAVMKAARALGATDAMVLRYADSGDVSGDKSAVVGYMAAVFGQFGSAH